MSFIKEGFSTVGGNARKGLANSIFSYKNVADSKADMLEDDYFNDAAFDVNTDDTIICTASDGTIILHVVSSTLVQGKGLVEVDNDLEKDAGSSTVFKNIFKFSDFPLEDDVLVPENGVIYLLYLQSFKNHYSIVFPEIYNKGGAFIYMGEGKNLKWTTTTDKTIFIDFNDLVFGGGNIAFHNIHFVSDDTSSVTFGIDGDLVSEAFDKILLDGITMENFKRAIRLDSTATVVHIRDFDMIVEDGVSTGATVTLKNMVNVILEHCFFKNTNVVQRVLSFENIGSVKTIEMDDVEINAPTGATGPFHLDGSWNGSFIKVNNMKYTNGNDREFEGGAAFEFLKKVNIASITAGVTGIKVTTVEEHGASVSDKCHIWGSRNDYAARNATISTITSPTIFEIDSLVYSQDAFTGSCLVGSGDMSIIPEMFTSIIFKSCSGIENTAGLGQLHLDTLQSNQVFPNITNFQRPVITSLSAEAPRGATNVNFIYDQGIAFFTEYIGLEPIRVKVYCRMIATGINVGPESYLISIGAGDQIATDMSRIARGEFFSIGSAADEIIEVEAILEIMPGDEVGPVIRRDSGGVTDGIILKRANLLVSEI